MMQKTTLSENAPLFDIKRHGAWLALVTLLLPGQYGYPAQAQFTAGSSLGSSSSVNLPMAPTGDPFIHLLGRPI